MGKKESTPIDLVEASYDLEVENDEWLPNIMRAGLPIFDRGLGLAGLIGVKPPTPGPIDIKAMHVASGPLDFPMRHMAAMAEFPPDLLHEETMHGNVSTMSEQTAPQPWMLATWTRHVSYASDGLGVTALDPDGYGIHLMAPLSEVTTLRTGERQQFQMMAAHLASGHRLKRAMQTQGGGDDEPILPLGADAVIDTKDLRVTDAVGEAASPTRVEVLRQRAVAIDRARGRLRRDDPEQALKIWLALVEGRWSLVDWFDSDERRYILAIPNPPGTRDPRALTKRESQVVGYAALGESHKIIGYRLGIARSTVTNTLRSAMRKLGVSTQAQLVRKLRGMELPETKRVAGER